MIKLYYSGATKFNESQTLASKSLGSFISNTAVSNANINSLFSSISLMELYNNKKSFECIGLGLYIFFFDGEPTYDKIDYKLSLQYNSENQEDIELYDYFKGLFTFEFGLGPISGDDTEGYYLEKIISNSKAFYLTHDFQKLDFGSEIEFKEIDISENKGVALWACRTFDSKKAKNLLGLKSNYWENHCQIPNLEFNFLLNIDFEESTKNELDVSTNIIRLNQQGDTEIFEVESNTEWNIK